MKAVNEPSNDGAQDNPFTTSLHNLAKLSKDANFDQSELRLQIKNFCYQYAKSQITLDNKNTPSKVITDIKLLFDCYKKSRDDRLTADAVFVYLGLLLLIDKVSLTTGIGINNTAAIKKALTNFVENPLLAVQDFDFHDLYLLIRKFYTSNHEKINNSANSNETLTKEIKETRLTLLQTVFQTVNESQEKRIKLTDKSTQYVIHQKLLEDSDLYQANKHFALILWDSVDGQRLTSSEIAYYAKHPQNQDADNYTTLKRKREVSKENSSPASTADNSLPIARDQKFYYLKTTKHLIVITLLSDLQNRLDDLNDPLQQQYVVRHIFQPAILNYTLNTAGDALWHLLDKLLTLSENKPTINSFLKQLTAAIIQYSEKANKKSDACNKLKDRLQNSEEMVDLLSFDATNTSHNHNILLTSSPHFPLSPITNKCLTDKGAINLKHTKKCDGIENLYLSQSVHLAQDAATLALLFAITSKKLIAIIIHIEELFPHISKKDYKNFWITTLNGDYYFLEKMQEIPYQNYRYEVDCLLEKAATELGNVSILSARKSFRFLTHDTKQKLEKIKALSPNNQLFTELEKKLLNYETEVNTASQAIDNDLFPDLEKLNLNPANTDYLTLYQQSKQLEHLLKSNQITEAVELLHKNSRLIYNNCLTQDEKNNCGLTDTNITTYSDATKFGFTCLHEKIWTDQNFATKITQHKESHKKHELYLSYAKEKNPCFKKLEHEISDIQVNEKKLAQCQNLTQMLATLVLLHKGIDTQSFHDKCFDAIRNSNTVATKIVEHYISNNGETKKSLATKFDPQYYHIAKPVLALYFNEESDEVIGDKVISENPYLSYYLAEQYDPNQAEKNKKIELAVTLRNEEFNFFEYHSCDNIFEALLNEKTTKQSIISLLTVLKHCYHWKIQKLNISAAFIDELEKLTSDIDKKAYIALHASNLSENFSSTTDTMKNALSENIFEKKRVQTIMGLKEIGKEELIENKLLFACSYNFATAFDENDEDKMKAIVALYSIDYKSSSSKINSIISDTPLKKQLAQAIDNPTKIRAIAALTMIKSEADLDKFDQSDLLQQQLSDTLQKKLDRQEKIKQFKLSVTLCKNNLSSHFSKIKPEMVERILMNEDTGHIKAIVAMNYAQDKLIKNTVSLCIKKINDQQDDTSAFQKALENALDAETICEQAISSLVLLAEIGIREDFSSYNKFFSIIANTHKITCSDDMSKKIKALTMLCRLEESPDSAQKKIDDKNVCDFLCRYSYDFSNAEKKDEKLKKIKAHYKLLQNGCDPYYCCNLDNDDIQTVNDTNDSDKLTMIVYVLQASIKSKLTDYQDLQTQLLATNGNKEKIQMILNLKKVSNDKKPAFFNALHSIGIKENYSQILLDNTADCFNKCNGDILKDENSTNELKAIAALANHTSPYSYSKNDGLNREYLKKLATAWDQNTDRKKKTELVRLVYAIKHANLEFSILEQQLQGDTQDTVFMNKIWLEYKESDIVKALDAIRQCRLLANEDRFSDKEKQKIIACCKQLYEFGFSSTDWKTDFSNHIKQSMNQHMERGFLNKVGRAILDILLVLTVIGIVIPTLTCGSLLFSTQPVQEKEAVRSVMKAHIINP